MVAAGLDTLPGNINMTIAYLSSPHGQAIQKRIYQEIINSYPDEDPWHAVLIEEKSDFVRSFVKEVLRYWPTLNLSFNRQSVKDITYKGATIPAGTPFLLVSSGIIPARNRTLMVVTVEHVGCQPRPRTIPQPHDVHSGPLYGYQ